MSQEQHRLRPLSLAFADDALEKDFQSQSLPRLRLQARIALLIGGMQYLSFGLFDSTYIPADTPLAGVVWTIRLLALVPGVAIFALSWHRLFDRHPHSLVCVSGLAAAIGMLATLALLPTAAVPQYYPAIAVFMAWIYNLSGLGFPWAFVTGLFITVGYNVIFLFLRDDLPLSNLLLHDFIIVSANCVGILSAYLVEWQRRRLFVNERLLDDQRHAILQQALHDPLTGLPNRTLLDDRLQQAIIQADRGRHRSAGLYIDLDGFKPLNDTHGHEAGDQVLREVANRLRDAMREADTVARIGGDEFFIVAPQIGSTESAMALAGKLQIAVQAPIWLSGGTQMVRVGASIGICLFPFSGATPERVLQCSDRCMYAAKRDGRGRAVLGAD